MEVSKKKKKENVIILLNSREGDREQYRRTMCKSELEGAASCYYF